MYICVFFSEDCHGYVFEHSSGRVGFIWTSVEQRFKLPSRHRLEFTQKYLFFTFLWSNGYFSVDGLSVGAMNQDAGPQALNLARTQILNQPSNR